MEIVILYPRKNSAFYTGIGSVLTRSLFASDSLASALCSCCARDSHEDMRSFFDALQPLSSVFFGVDALQTKILFLPLWLTYQNAALAQENRKYQKQAKWISVQAYLAWMEHRDDTVCLKQGYILTHDEYALLSRMFSFSSPSPFFTPLITTRVRIDRLSDRTVSGGLYTLPAVVPQDHVFFYVLCSSLSLMMREAFQELVFQGIGGKRSVGYGTLDSVSITPLETIAPAFRAQLHKSASSYASLSILYLQDPLHLEQLEAYQLFFSQGYVSGSAWSVQRKTRVGIKEGAVARQPLPGALHQEKIYRTGTVLYRFGNPLWMPLREGDSHG